MTTKNTKTQEVKTESTAVENEKKVNMEIIQGKEKSFADFQKSLQEELKRFERINIKIENRGKFIYQRDLLVDFKSKIENEIKTNGNFETDNFSLKFGAKESYRDSVHSTISNCFIINEFLVFILEKIELKIVELEKEILEG